MKFQFTLEKVLHHKKIQEDVAKKDFTEAQVAVDLELEKKRKMERSIYLSRKKSFDLQRQGGAEAHSLQSIEEYIVLETERIKAQDHQIEIAIEQLEQKREILVQAGKEFKALEKLKEKRFKDFKNKKRKHEAKQLDDIVTMRSKGVVRYGQ